MKTPMENARQNSRDDLPPVGIKQVADDGCPAAAVVPIEMPTVGDLARHNFVSLPAWFGCAKACAVLRSKASDFVLVSDERGARRVASLEQLATAPAERGIVAYATPFGPGIALSTPADRALRSMDAQASDHVGVVSGGVVVGILSRDILTAVVAGACARRSGAYQTGDSPFVRRLAA